MQHPNLTRTQRRPWIVLLAFAALTLAPALSSLASARPMALRRGSAKTNAAQMHRSPVQQRLGSQRMRARLKTSQRRPRSLRIQVRQSAKSTSGRVVTRRGPLRRRPQRRTQFSRRARRASRSIDSFGRWTRHDPYSLR